MMQMMISRRNFFSITIMMFVIFFLFLFSGAAKEALSNYSENEYAKIEHREVEPFVVKENMDEISGEYVIYLGSNEDVYNVVKQWCRYNRLDLATVSPGSITVGSRISVDSVFDKIPDIVLVDGASLTSLDADLLLLFDHDGIPIVFLNMPSAGYLSANKTIANMMGISNVQQTLVPIAGMHLYEEFLLGGDMVYLPSDELDEEEAAKIKDLPSSVPWLILGSASKVYMDGILDEDAYGDVDAAYKPPIIWRYNTGTDYVFAVNADFMSDVTGIGILTAMRAQLEDAYLYPVVNAQNLVMTNYPSFTLENDSEMRAIYSRDSAAVLRDLIWPGMTSVIEKSDANPSCMLSAKQSYTASGEPNADSLTYFLQLMREVHSEGGLDLVAGDGTDASEKLSVDTDFFNRVVPNYDFQMAYIGDMDVDEAKGVLESVGEDDVATLLKDYDPTGQIIDIKDDFAVVSSVNEGSKHTFRDDLRTRSIETALGYSVVSEDMYRVIYPKSEDDHWQNIYNSFSGNMNNYWTVYDAFSETTVSETGDRSRMFLGLTYEASYDDGVVDVNCNISEFMDEAYFVLRIPKGEVTYVMGGDFTKIEDNAYLISLNKSSGKIYYKSTQESGRARVNAH